MGKNKDSEISKDTKLARKKNNFNVRSRLINRKRLPKKGDFVRDFFSRELGTKTIKLIDVNQKLPEVTFSSQMKPGVLSRMIDKSSGKLKADKAINRIYRGAHISQDELFSTALTREFVKGFFPNNGSTPLNKKQLAYLEEMIDLASSARIPTEHSGFASIKEVMQHPANRGNALFADPYETASLHSNMDTERRNYVERAMKKAIEDGGDAKIVMIKGVKAAIEYTLNYFTAPITADNVFKYTKQKGKDLKGKILQDQLISRERMKKLYLKLGGKLRVLKFAENQEQSWRRDWGIGLSGEAAPPSPFRQPTKSSNFNNPEALVLD